MNEVANHSAGRTLGPVPDLEHHLPQEWWRTLFNALYLKTDGDVVENLDNTRADIDLLLAATGIGPEDVVLDLCCGQGRHALELASRGYAHVTGIDRSRYLVNLARRRARKAGLDVRFREGDARNIRVAESSINCISIMGNSFGYFEREEDDARVLRSAFRALASNGRIFLDVVDGEWMRENFERRSWEWIDQNLFVNRERSLARDGRRIISREVITNAETGVIADQFYAERLYSREEMLALLESCGFRDLQCHGAMRSESTRGQDLGMMAHRMIFTAAVGNKPRRRRSQRAQEIMVLLGDPCLPDVIKRDGQFNAEDLETVARLKHALGELDQYAFRYADSHQGLLRKLQDNRPELVLNLCDEGFRNRATMELHVPALLEILDIPYTGAAPACLALCYDKANVRAIAQSMDIPVPMELLCNPDDLSAHIPSVFPALLKPSQGDSSFGITRRAVVHDKVQLFDYLNEVRSRVPGVPILVQEFLTGREFTVGLIGNPGRLHTLPILEVDYSGLPDGLPPILSYESKWDPDSPYWNDIAYIEASLSEDLRNELVNYSRLLFERTGCRDYARFDFRMDVSGQIRLLEVNPNPGWCHDGKLNLMAGMAGMRYAELLAAIVDAARERLGMDGAG